MTIDTLLLNSALDGQFNGGGRTYSVILLYDGSPNESDPETVDFTAASNGSVGFTSSIFFAVPSGTTVIGLQVLNDLNDILIEESVPDETFSSNGTFTINNIIITLND